MNYINDFWVWAGMSPVEYSKNGFNHEQRFEDEYPNFDKMINYAKNLIGDTDITAKKLDDILTIMAIDHESEEILDYVVQNYPSEKLVCLIELGIEHIQPNARWQIGELIYRRKPIDYMLYLERLQNDNDSYVRKRASNLVQLEWK